MLNWIKILCALDFSESSRQALEHAADLARRFGAELAALGRLLGGLDCLTSRRFA